ncbi:MAG: DUF3795 domain-containing protein [Anaerolineales bacterium]|nr:DUF3795 domain-containing protein [Anaerolineales bacterium]
MNILLGVCGIDCSQCAAYLATQANDEAAKAKVAAQWREEYHAPNIDIAYVTCDGCLATTRLCGHCAECDVRLCAVARGLENCALCPDYACEKISNLHTFILDAKARLDQIHSSR